MKKILGSNKWTSIAGYLVSGLMIYDQMQTAGQTSPVKIGIAVAVGILGRVAGDSEKKTPKL